MTTPLQRTMTQSLYLLVGFGATILALAEAGVPLTMLLTLTQMGAVLSLLPVLLTLPIAWAAYEVVEKRGWFISVRTASILGLIAIAVSLSELWLRGIEGRILFAAHLLVYLSWVLLWQEKERRQRGGLIALAILQVAAACVLTNAGWFGVSMIALMVLAVWTVVLVQIAEAESRPPATGSASALRAASGPRSLLAPPTFRPIGAERVLHWPKGALWRSVGITVVGSLAIGAAFFLFVPRLDFGLRAFGETSSAPAERRITGFNEHIRLGDFGAMLQSSATAFHVRVLDQNGEPIPVEQYAARLGMTEPLFRGVTLSWYSDGEWSARDWGRPIFLAEKRPPASVVQQYQLEAGNTSVLFAMTPIMGGQLAESDAPIGISSKTGVLRATSAFGRHGGRGAADYEVYSPTDPRQRERLRTRPSFLVENGLGEANLEVPLELDRVASLADIVAGTASTKPAKAQALLHFLRDSGKYKYSLQGGLSDPALDPIADFLFNRKTGHCEYFASALALMLRSQGIPARIVNGYKGGIPNKLSGWYEVQQRHAHSWVEAYFDRHWVTLDPSPAAGRASVVEESGPTVPLWNQIVTSSTIFWRDFVVKLDGGQQRKMFKPLRAAAILTYQQARDTWWPTAKQRVYTFATNPKRWFSWQGGLITFVGLLIVVGLWWASRRALRRLRRRQREERRARQRQLLVAFYEEFRDLCRERGLRARPAQTPREFAREFTQSLQMQQLPSELLPSELRALPEEVTLDYYRLRFGELELPPGRGDHYHRQLTVLRDALARADEGAGNGMTTP